MPVDYEAARQLLEKEFAAIEESFLSDQRPKYHSLYKHIETIFFSQTQAYREVLLGCVLVRLLDKSVNIQKPYVNQGNDAYNGRTLDEKVINPFLHNKRIPSSRGPFLSTFRRSVMFNEATREGLRDKKGYDSLLALITFVAKEKNDSELKLFLHNLLYEFIELRRATEIPLSRIHRISLEQYDGLITGLLSTASGGRFPVILIEAIFQAIKERFALDWEIETHGINVADRPSGAGGDITIKSKGAIVMVAEITERPVDKNRVTATFQTKIAPHGIEDYLFFVTSKVDEDAKRQARQYFSQGHEVNFMEIKNWILTILSALGKPGRELFNKSLVEKLDAEDIPPSLKLAWNEQIAKITAA